MDPRNLKGIFRLVGMSDYFAGTIPELQGRYSETVYMGYNVRFGSDRVNEGLYFRRSGT
ncbi:hypothetical protein M422DRAFT_40024 [Sphaerobolus stellatus SS14]|uniref:Uncharacterized protein n=1 Tax=Sphaerobolus stellatus (strain SS14) TaxID=990650 RepID=A0A0C9TL21_SPHS4|nr:hypothetical protein M422DRAFT_40024 [Sphaerobolus stellatus SS14]